VHGGRPRQVGLSGVLRSLQLGSKCGARSIPQSSCTRQRGDTLHPHSRPRLSPHTRPPSRYLRHREALLAALLLLHAALLRWAPLPLPAGALPGVGGALLPWLLRATGCEALALFSLGFKASCGRSMGTELAGGRISGAVAEAFRGAAAV
jgi:hypothetical protein